MNNLSGDSYRDDASAVFFNEDFLHYVWKYKLFNLQKLQTIYEQQVSIINGGTHNENEGPDFLNSELIIDGQHWVGNVEIHIKSSDWYVHKHEIDKNYDAVALHVVWEYDIPVLFRNGSEVPTVELKWFVDADVLDSYNSLLKGNKKWILCEDSIASTNVFRMEAWLNRLYIERLEEKSKQIFTLLQNSQNNWEAVLFQLIAKSFGMKLNASAFLSLSTSFDFSIIGKNQHKQDSLENLLLGQAGFFEQDLEDAHYIEMKKEYTYLQKKYNLIPLRKQQFQFFRLRPSNFPTLRISQLARLYEKQQNLFSKVIDIKDVEKYYELFEVETSAYWKTHYVFGKESKIRSHRVSKPFIDILLLNAILPIKYAFMRHYNKVDFDELEKVLLAIKPEKNAIIQAFQQRGVQVNSAFDSQALLQLKNSYCDNKRCLQCAIGLQLLRSKP